MLPEESINFTGHMDFKLMKRSKPKQSFYSNESSPEDVKTGSSMLLCTRTAQKIRIKCGCQYKEGSLYFIKYHFIYVEIL